MKEISTKKMTYEKYIEYREYTEFDFKYIIDCTDSVTVSLYLEIFNNIPMVFLETFNKIYNIFTTNSCLDFLLLVSN